MFIIKDELGHSEEKFAKIIQLSLSKGSDPDTVTIILERIRSGQKVPDPQHWIRIHNSDYGTSIIILYTEESSQGQTFLFANLCCGKMRRLVAPDKIAYLPA